MIITSGKRKRAMARAVLSEGSGKIRINKKDYNNLQFLDKFEIEELLRIAKEILGNLKFDAEISTKGGGEKGQIEAARVALARAIVKFSGSRELISKLNLYDRNILVADVRRKEPCKPGDSKARRKRQSSRR